MTDPVLEQLASFFTVTAKVVEAAVGQTSLTDFVSPSDHRKLTLEPLKALSVMQSPLQRVMVPEGEKAMVGGLHTVKQAEAVQPDEASVTVTQ